MSYVGLKITYFKYKQFILINTTYMPHKGDFYFKNYILKRERTSPSYLLRGWGGGGPT